MTLPPFSDFINSLDAEKISYDLGMYSSPDMAEPYNPFTKEQYLLLVKTNITMMQTLLAQYHEWLSEQLP